MTQEIVIPYVRGKIADGCKRFDLDIVCRMVIEYDRVQAENEKLTERLEEWREQYATVISEACPPDEQHCTCVPMLRVEIKRLRAALEEIASEEKDAEIIRLREEIQRLRASIPGYQAEVRIV